MAVVYHWKHGWIPLDHVAALSKAKGNHAAAAKMLEDAHGSRGITSRQDVAKAALDLPNVPHADRADAHAQLHAGAQQHGATDLLPGNRGSVTRSSSDSEHQFQMANEKGRSAVKRPADHYPVKADGSPDYGAMSSEQAASIRAKERGMGVGAHVVTDQGPGTVKAVSSRGTVVELDQPGAGSIHVASGTPGHDRMRPAPQAKSRATRDQFGVKVGGNGPTEVSVAGLPNGYRITKDQFGLALIHNGKIIRTSATREALVAYAHEHHG